MNKFLFFIGLGSIAYWLITGNADFYKIATGVLTIILGFFDEMSDSWKYDATKYRFILQEMSKDVDALFGEGAADKLLALSKANTLKHLKEVEESEKEIPDVIRKEIEKLKAELEKETT